MSSSTSSIPEPRGTAFTFASSVPSSSNQVWIILIAVIVAATLPLALGLSGSNNKNKKNDKMMSPEKTQRPLSPRGLIPTNLGMIHYQAVNLENVPETNDDDASLIPIVAFHMSPRSVDEYTEIMAEYEEEIIFDNDSEKEIGDKKKKPPPRPFIAMDELGYGASDNPFQSCSLDELADCCLQVMDALQLKRVVVAGSLMGCYMALSLAARYPERIAGVICSNLYYFPLDKRQEALAKEAKEQKETEQLNFRRQSQNITNAWKNPGSPSSSLSSSLHAPPSRSNSMNSSINKPIPDSWELRDDGSHINDIFPKRASWLSKELNTRCTLDNLNYNVKRRERYSRGVTIQDGPAFLLDQTCAQITCPVLCCNGQAAHQFLDAIGMQMSSQFESALKCFTQTRPKVVTIEPPGSSINMLNENAVEWVELVETFCRETVGSTQAKQ